MDKIIDRNEYLNIRKGGVDNLFQIYQNEAEENKNLQRLNFLPFEEEKKQDQNLTLNSWVNKIIKSLLLHGGFDLAVGNRLSFNQTIDNNEHKTGRPRTKASNRTYVCEAVWNTKREPRKTYQFVPEQNRICRGLANQEETLENWINRTPNITRKLRELFDNNKDQIDMKDFKEWVSTENLIPPEKKFNINLIKKDDKIRYLLLRGFNKIYLDNDIYRLIRNQNQGQGLKKKKKIM